MRVRREQGDVAASGRGGGGQVVRRERWRLVGSGELVVRERSGAKDGPLAQLCTLVVPPHRVSPVVLSVEPLVSLPHVVVDFRWCGVRVCGACAERVRSMCGAGQKDGGVNGRKKGRGGGTPVASGGLEEGGVRSGEDERMVSEGELGERGTPLPVGDWGHRWTPLQWFITIAAAAAAVALGARTYPRQPRGRPRSRSASPGQASPASR